MLQVSLKPYHASDLQVSACTSAAASIHATHHNSIAGVMHSLKCTSINLPPLAGVGDMTCMVQCGCKSGPLCAEMHCGDVLHSCTAHTHKALSMPHLSQLSNAHSQSVWYTPHTLTPAGYINRMQCASTHMHNVLYKQAACNAVWGRASTAMKPHHTAKSSWLHRGQANYCSCTPGIADPTA